MKEPWAMFTYDQGQELIDNTTSEWTAINNVKGRKFTSKTDNSNYIFLPAGGYWDNSSHLNDGLYGRYWSIQRHPTNTSSAWYMFISSSDAGINYIGARFCGRPIRSIRNR